MAALELFGEVNAEWSNDWVDAGSHNLNLAAELAGGCGNLAADEPGSEHDYFGARLEFFAKRDGVVEGSNCVTASKFAVGYLEPFWAESGRDD